MIRLTGGEFRGRSIRTPASLHTRPTQAKLRQALFNSIQAYVPEARVLDLFAGSGALGFEALSRGATSVVFVESVRSVAALIEQNARELGVQNRVTIRCEDAATAFKRLAEAGAKATAFDVVMADPPYSEGWETRLVAEPAWDRLLTAEGIFCLEWGIVKAQVDAIPDETRLLVKAREKNYGDSRLTTYRRAVEPVADGG